MVKGPEEEMEAGVDDDILGNRVVVGEVDSHACFGQLGARVSGVVLVPWRDVLTMLAGKASNIQDSGEARSPTHLQVSVGVEKSGSGTGELLTSGKAENLDRPLDRWELEAFEHGRGREGEGLGIWIRHLMRGGLLLHGVDQLAQGVEGVAHVDPRGVLELADNLVQEVIGKCGVSRQGRVSLDDRGSQPIIPVCRTVAWRAGDRRRQLDGGMPGRRWARIWRWGIGRLGG